LAGALPSPALCLITDETRSPSNNDRNVHAALDGGCRWVQLRNRRITTLEFYRWAERLRSVTEAYRAVLVVNDRIDVALAVGADGAHLPANGLAPAHARRLLGPDALLGRSVHSIEEIAALAAAGLDYFQFGPVFDTQSKRAYGDPQGLDKLRAAVEAAGPIAVCGVGGITPERAAQICSVGAQGVAVIAAIHAVADAGVATQQMLDALNQTGG
jgi:thiamine-phosphate diphosphorylase